MPSETTKKGELACLKFEQRALERGFIVSRPVLECEYDRVIEIEKKLYRVQVKYADCMSGSSEGAVQANIARSATNTRGQLSYDENDVDAIVLYIPKIDQLCWLDKTLWAGKLRLTVRYETSKNKQSKGCHMACDYAW